MKCKICDSKNIQFISKWDEKENEYTCLGCGRTIVTNAHNEDKDVKV